MANTISITEYLLRRLKELNVNHLFGIPGDYVLPFFDELIDCDTGVAHVGSKNELNAGYSADGYAKINGFGAAAVTFGVGTLSTVNAVAGAYSDNTPMVLITGAPSRSARPNNGGKLLHHLLGTDFDTCMKIMSEVTIEALRLDSENTAPAEIDALLITSFRHKKPVYLEIPYDLQQAQVTAPASALQLNYPMSNAERLSDAVDKIKRLALASSAISSLVGPLLDRNRLISEADQVIRTLNAAVATVFTAKIPDFEDHPQAAGFYQGMSCEDACRDAIEGSDLIITFGSTFNEFDTGMFTAKLGIDQNEVHLCNDHVIVDGEYIMDVYLCDILPALAKALEGGTYPALQLDTEARKFAFQLDDAFEPTNADLKIDRMFIQFANSLHAGDTLVGDTGGYINSAQAQFRSGVSIYGCGNWGSLGAGFGMSVGASIARSEAPQGEVVCITGDGAFLMSAQELATLVQHEINITLIVLDNAGYGAERQIWPGKERSYNDFLPWNYEQLPAVFGGIEGKNCQGFIARSEKEFDTALKAARTIQGVKVIRAHIDRWDTASFNVKMSEAMRH